MGLQDFWFIALAVTVRRLLRARGFRLRRRHVDGVFRPRRQRATANSTERAVLNTIGPVWDGNEVWLITAGGAMFAAFPGMYATVFSGLYLPLLAILCQHDRAHLRNRVARQGRRSRAGVDGPTSGIAIGSWVPAVLWGVAFAALCAGFR